MAEIREFAWRGLRFVRIATDVRSLIVLPLVVATIPFWRRSQKPPKERSFNVRIHGKKVPVVLAGWTEYEVLCEIAIEDDYVLRAELSPRTIVDLGAQVGLSPLFFAIAFPDAKIVAVEADPALIDRLQRNVAGCDVTVIHAAVASQPGKIAFFHGEESWANSTVRTRESQEEIEVDAITIDGVRERSGIDRIDLLKVDVEGAEWDLFQDGVPECVDYVIGEIHCEDGREPEQLVELLSIDLSIESSRASEIATVFWGPRR